ncbi:MAG: aminotransferase class I/II-fold pyridoxal phosphate-dependent enzyme [Oligoflexales bacterium]|nr:aminotransferase class I/II-fold pyridoxal phosphate-dependent enzyme [Oligoflexales bacterium]
MLHELRHLEVVMIDESFIDFCDDVSAYSVRDIVHKFDNAYVIASLGKSLGYHGVRLGYTVSKESNIEAIRNFIPYWNINGIAAHIAKRLPHYKDQFEASLKESIRLREEFAQKLSQCPFLKVYPSQANFVMCTIDRSVNGTEVVKELLKNYNIFGRECKNKVGGDANMLRFAIRTSEHCDRLIKALFEVYYSLSNK